MPVTSRNAILRPSGDQVVGNLHVPPTVRVDAEHALAKGFVPYRALEHKLATVRRPVRSPALGQYADVRYVVTVYLADAQHARRARQRGPGLRILLRSARSNRHRLGLRGRPRLLWAGAGIRARAATSRNDGGGQNGASRVFQHSKESWPIFEIGLHEWFFLTQRVDRKGVDRSRSTGFRCRRK